MLQIVDHIVREGRGNRTGLKLRARALSALERNDEAVSAWEELAALTPVSVDAPLNIARLAKRRDDWPAVLAACSRVLLVEADHAEALKLPRQAIVRDPKVHGSDPMWRGIARNDFSGLLEIILELEGQGRLLHAASAIAIASEIRPDDHAIIQERKRITSSLVDRANTEEAIGNLQGAAAALRAAVVTDVNGGEAYKVRVARLVKPIVSAAREQFAAKDLVQASESYNQALVLDPDNNAALTGVARCHEAANDWAAATEIWRRVTAGDPRNEQAWLRLGVCSEKLGLFEDAYHAYGHVVSDQYADNIGRGREKLADRAYMAARAHYSAMRFEEAARAVSVAGAIRTNSEITTLKRRVARALRRLQKAAFVERDNTKTVDIGALLFKLDTSEVEPIVLQARALHGLKEYGRAFKAWEQAAQHSPERADVQFGLARSAYEIGAFSEGRAALELATALAPNDERNAVLLARYEQQAGRVMAQSTAEAGPLAPTPAVGLFNLFPIRR